MKVLHVIPGIARGGGGPSRSVQGLVAVLCKVGVDARLYPFDGAEPWVSGVRKLQCLNVQNVRMFDLVHIHGIWDPKLHQVTVMCRKAGVPYVIAPRGMLEPWSLQQKWLKKRIARFLYQDRDLKLAAALHATAESEAEQFRRLGFKNKIIISPNGVNVPEKDVNADASHTQNFAKSDVSTTGAALPATQSAFREVMPSNRRALAERKVEEWLEGVTEKSFCAALEKLVAEKLEAGEYLFEKQEDKEKAISAAKAFFNGYSRKLVELSDGRCVYFAPDPRSKMRHADITACWAEYAFHAVSAGGEKIPGKNYNYRKYSDYKVVNTDLIEDTLKSERCVPVLRDKPLLDSVKFFGSAHLGGLFDVVARLDECGNANANMTEVTFEASTKRGPKKLPQLVSLAEAIRTVVSHQTATGTYPSDNGILPNHDHSRKGDGRRALFVSRMHPKKGVLELVESWSRLKHSNNPNIRTIEQWSCELVYTMNSDEERAYEQKVKQRVHELGLDDQFVFTGALDDEKKWEAYSRADLFVLPTYSENFGIVVAEALWAGVPVITTKGTPWKELETCECGWWIDLPPTDSLDVALKEAIGCGARSPALTSGKDSASPLGKQMAEEWRSGILSASEKKQLRGPLEELGRHGHELVESKYTWAAVCDKMVRGYEEVLNGRT